MATLVATRRLSVLVPAAPGTRVQLGLLAPTTRRALRARSLRVEPAVVRRAQRASTAWAPPQLAPSVRQVGLPAPLPPPSIMPRGCLWEGGLPLDTHSVRSCALVSVCCGRWMLCAPGKYGATTSLSAAACSGDCNAGYICPSGSTSATASICPAGQYSGTGASACIPCPAGRYGDVGAQTTSACVGACAIGRYGDAASQTSSSCVGACVAGKYGDAPGQTVSTCVGPCQVRVHDSNSYPCALSLNCAALGNATASHLPKSLVGRLAVCASFTPAACSLPASCFVCVPFSPLWM
jgi:hypothetical protein